MIVTVRRSTALTAATSVLAGAVALIAQIAGVLDLRPSWKVLSAVGVCLLAAFAQRLGGCWKEHQAVKDAVRVWPLPPLGVVPLKALGVYPAANASGQETKYKSRPTFEEDALAAALSDHENLIVYGPPRCGKSRAVAEAAREKLATTLAVIPRDAGALASLLDGGVRLPGSRSQLCLWLDGLDRFMDALDPCSIATLDAQRPKIVVVATIRTDSWGELLAGNTQLSETARAFTTEATIVELSDFSPPDAEESADELTSAVRVRLGRWWMDGGLASIGLSFLAIMLFGLISWPHPFLPAPIGEQMAKLKAQALSEAGPQGGHVVVDERVAFHSAEEPSWLLVVEPLQSHDKFDEAVTNTSHPAPRSDDLRIYDVVNKELRLELHYRPRVSGRRAAEWQSLQAGAKPSFDYDSDGSPEVIAGYGLYSEADGAMLPFGIDWNNGSYKLVSLNTVRPHLGTYGLDTQMVRFQKRTYETPVTLKTEVTEPAFKGIALEGYRVQAFALANERLLTGYSILTPDDEKPQTLEIHASQFRIGELAVKPCVPSYAACSAPEAEQDTVVPPDQALDYGLLEAWGRLRYRWGG